MTARIMAVCVAAGGLMMAGAFLWLNRGAWTTSNDVVFADPAAAVRDARALIATREGHMILPAELPLTLRIPGLRWANVHLP